MTVETALYPPQLNTAWPQASDMVSEGDNHIRLTKTVIKTTFPNVAGAVSATDVQLSYVTGVTSPIQAQINSKGAIAGQTWTGSHVFSGTAAVPTLAQGTNTTGAASTAFVQAEWATRLPNYTAPITASSTEFNRLVGVTSGVQGQIDAKGAIAGQTWTGTHNFTGAAVTVPTVTAGDATNNAASTAFVTGAVGAVAATQVAAAIHAAPSKTTPADADELGLSDSAASWGLKKLTFANLKAWIGGIALTRLEVGASPAQVPAGQHLGKLAYMDELAALRATLTQPQAIGAVWVERVSDTSIKLFMRGSDGVARSTTLTLS